MYEYFAISANSSSYSDEADTCTRLLKYAYLYVCLIFPSVLFCRSATFAEDQPAAAAAEETGRAEGQGASESESGGGGRQPRPREEHEAAELGWMGAMMARKRARRDTAAEQLPDPYEQYAVGAPDAPQSMAPAEEDADSNPYAGLYAGGYTETSGYPEPPPDDEPS